MTRSRVPSKAVQVFLSVLLFSATAAAQSASLSLASGSGAPGTVVDLNLSLSAAVLQPGGLQWTVSYPTTNISSLNVTSGGLSTVSLSCSASSGLARCVEYGLNSNTISNGVVATLAFTLSSTATGSSSVTVQSDYAVSEGGSQIPAAATGGTLSISSTAPVINSASSANGTVGTAFTYQITATNSPTSFGASGLPAGLSVNTSTGLISGTPSAAGTSTVTLSASNGGGTGTAQLSLTVVSAKPAITSSTSANGTVGTAFTYQITATNSPTNFGASGLPAGLSVNTSTGLISGTPSAAGTSTVTLSASNGGGTGTAQLSLTVVPAEPMITSSTSANGTVGTAFTYQITASNSPTSFGASGLPAGLSVNTASGVISGTPTAGGSFAVTISATNSGGTGTATLTLVVATAVDCSFSLDLNAMTVPVGSSSQQFEIIAPANTCSWTATSNASWLQLTQSGGTGTADISYTVSANKGALPRSGTMTVSGQTFTVIQQGTNPPVPGDPLGYGKLGLVWTNTTTSQSVWWYMNGGGGNQEASWAWISQNGVPGWHVGAIADFNGDGYSDIFWVNDVTRQAVVWYMGGAGGNVEQSWEWISEAGVPGWSLVGAADFNGDGIPDLLWQNDTTQQVVIWYMAGAGTNGTHTWAWLSSSGVPGWGIQAVADFNHDGTPDVVWENETTGQSVIWYLSQQGTVELSWEWISSQPLPGWTITGAGDFNGDGNIDVMMVDNSTGQAIFWYLEGPGTNGEHTWAWVSADGVPGWWPSVTH